MALFLVYPSKSEQAGWRRRLQWAYNPSRRCKPLAARSSPPNRLESVNALVEERCAKVDAWKNSNQAALADRGPVGHRTAATAGTEPFQISTDNGIDSKNGERKEPLGLGMIESVHLFLFYCRPDSV